MAVAAIAGSEAKYSKLNCPVLAVFGGKALPWHAELTRYAPFRQLPGWQVCPEPVEGGIQQRTSRSRQEHFGRRTPRSAQAPRPSCSDTSILRRDWSRRRQAPGSGVATLRDQCMVCCRSWSACTAEAPQCACARSPLRPDLCESRSAHVGPLPQQCTPCGWHGRAPPVMRLSRLPARRAQWIAGRTRERKRGSQPVRGRNQLELRPHEVTGYRAAQGSRAFRCGFSATAVGPTPSLASCFLTRSAGAGAAVRHPRPPSIWRCKPELSRARHAHFRSGRDQPAHER